MATRGELIVEGSYAFEVHDLVFKEPQPDGGSTSRKALVFHADGVRYELRFEPQQARTVAVALIEVTPPEAP